MENLRADLLKLSDGERLKRLLNNVFDAAREKLKDSSDYYFEDFNDYYNQISGIPLPDEKNDIDNQIVI